jgi:hypothetical protein
LILTVHSCSVDLIQISLFCTLKSPSNCFVYFFSLSFSEICNYSEFDIEFVSNSNYFLLNAYGIFASQGLWSALYSSRADRNPPKNTILYTKKCNSIHQKIQFYTPKNTILYTKKYNSIHQKMQFYTPKNITATSDWVTFNWRLEAVSR